MLIKFTESGEISEQPRQRAERLIAQGVAVAVTDEPPVEKSTPKAKAK